MKMCIENLFLLPALVASFGSVVTCAGASWIGSDGFSNGISTVNWTIAQKHEGVMLVVGTNGHASYIVPISTTSEQNAYILWKGTPAATDDWTADIFGQNIGPTGSKLKFSVSDTATLGTNGLTATTNRQAFELRMTGTTFSTTSWPGLSLGNGIARQSVAATSSEFGLRLVHRGGANGTVEAWYDPTATGTNWT